MIDNETQINTNVTPNPRVEVLPAAERRRRWTAEEKQQLLKESEMPVNSISAVARKYGVSPSQMFGWRKQFQKGGQIAVRANDDVVPVTEHKAALARIKEQLGRKTLESEILKEGIKVAKEKKLISRSQLQHLEDLL